MKAIETQQRSEEWFNLRRGIPTASRFDKIITAKKGDASSAQDSLINELISESILPAEQGVIRYVSAEMEQGMILEAEARCRYELDHATGPVSEVGFVLHDSGLFGGSPDALVGEDGGVEIKCPSGPVHVSYFRGGVLPDCYKQQVHGYMAVTGRNWWDFYSYCRNLPPFYLRVTRDEYTAKLERALFDFAAAYNTARKVFDLPPIGALQLNGGAA
jgi:hypothetical protein